MFALCSAAGCGRAPAPHEKLHRAGVEWTPCRLPRVSELLRCTSVDAPLHAGGERLPGRNAHRSKGVPLRIKLHVAVADALSAEKRADPLYFIAGGPGQASSGVAHGVLAALSKIRRHRDIVFVDVRGTGRSEPLNCDLDPADPLAELFADQWRVERVAACKRRHAHRDLTAFRTERIVEDLRHVAETLGHRTVNLYGISYGTRVALEWMRQAPKNLRSVILDGVVPPQMTLFQSFATDAQGALDKLAVDCLGESACKRRFGDVRLLLDRLLISLAKGPRDVEIAHPRTGARTTVRVTATGLVVALRSLLYSADLQALVPLALASAVTGDYAPLAAETLAISDGAASTTSMGLLFEVACAEDVTQTEVELADGATITFLGASLINQVRRACEAWRPQVVQKRDTRAVSSSVPTLLLSGALDPVTPHRWAQLAAVGLANAKLIEVGGAAHGTLATGCVPRLMAQFIDLATADGLDASCAEQTLRPAFFLSRSGPAP